jgi:hypothetical protein
VGYHTSIWVEECLIAVSSEIFPLQATESFHGAIRKHILGEISGLDPVALLNVKKLIRAGLNEKNNPDAVNLRESYGGLLYYSLI